MKKGKMHMRWEGTGIHYGTGTSLCSELIPEETLTRDWRKVTCKLCLRQEHPK